MSNADRRVIALGNLAGELKTSLEAAARAVGLELLLTREPARAFVELEREGALAVLVDMATLGAEQFCKRARGTERLRSVPVIGMSRHPNELGFARVFAWGADDLVPLGARMPLERRLQVLRDTPPPDTTGFGQAVVAEATTQRRALVGRVLAHAGYDVKFAVDRGAVELYASQAETRLVVISAALGDPRRIIENSARAGALPTWIVTVEARSTQRVAASLSGLERVAVTSTAGSPEDVLFLANELVFSKGPRRREWRALYATPVAFRSQGGDNDEYGFSYDASPSGLYVRSLLPCATEDVEVELRLPNRDERVRLSGKVARRFAFGSGAIASAPPGFSVKLEGPASDLARWTDACTALIAAASASESLSPPRPRAPSQPVLASAALGAKEVQLAIPATVSIESVVAPLPVSVQAAVAEGSDVGELLAATLDEQTLTEVGTRPVTIDPDTLGVREERPSEFAPNSAELLADAPPASLPAPLEPTIVTSPPVPMPVPMPAPRAAEPVVGAPIPMPAPRATEPARVDPQPASAPRPEPIPASAPRPEPVPASVPRPAEPARGLGGTLLLRPEPAEPAEPDAPLDVEASGLHAADWDADAKTTVRASQPSLEAPRPPSPDPPEVEVSGTLPKVERDEPDHDTPAKTLRLGGYELDVLAPTEPPPRPAEPPSVDPPRVDPPSVNLPRAEPTPAKSAPKAAPSTAATVRSAQPAPAVPRTANKHKPITASPAATPVRAGRVLMFVAAAAAATAVGMGLALVTRHPAPGSGPGVVVPQNPTQTATAVAPSAAPLNAGLRGAASATSTSVVNAVASTNATSLPASASAAASTGTPESSASATSGEHATTAPAAATTPPLSAATASAPLVAVPPASFDVNKLPRDRAALVVHSSANTHVFVHGADYGPTNQVLMTSCGIRFVRLGRALGDFIEPGESHVIKCGRLNELRIEPTP